MPLKHFTEVAARSVNHDAIPWVPLPGGKAFKPLRFLRGNRGFVELLRLEPGSEISTHRHTGEVHAFNVEGSRELSSGEIIRPGDYVYEPAGNIEYLGPSNSVTSVYTADTLSDLYRRHCEEHGLEILDLID